MSVLPKQRVSKASTGQLLVLTLFHFQTPVFERASLQPVAGGRYRTHASEERHAAGPRQPVPQRSPQPNRVAM